MTMGTAGARLGGREGAVQSGGVPYGFDRVLAGAAVLLVLCGLVLALVTTDDLAARNGLDRYHYVVRQLLYAIGSLVLMFAVSFCDERTVRRGGILLFGAILVATLLLPALGTDFAKGAQRWYSLGFFSFQPSEFLKTTFAITVAWFLAGAAQPNGPPGAAIAGLTVLAVAAILILQPDYGQAFLVVGIWGVMFYLAGASHFAVGLGVAGSAAVLAVATQVSDHVRGRIMEFVQTRFLSMPPERNSQGDHVEEAIRGAGWFGNGVNDGRINAHIAEAHSDYIVAAAADEFGLVVCGAIFCLYAVIGLRVAWRLGEPRSLFARLACAGVSVQIVLQALFHYGVNLRVLPAKGMALPFVSYGGSSMLAAGLAMGVLLALTRMPGRRPVRAPAGGRRPGKRS